MANQSIFDKACLAGEGEAAASYWFHKTADSSSFLETPLQILVEEWSLACRQHGGKIADLVFSR
jgi:hypothetical protein